MKKSTRSHPIQRASAFAPSATNTALQEEALADDTATAPATPAPARRRAPLSVVPASPHPEGLDETQATPGVTSEAPPVPEEPEGEQVSPASVTASPKKPRPGPDRPRDEDEASTPPAEPPAPDGNAAATVDPAASTGSVEPAGGDGQTRGGARRSRRRATPATTAAPSTPAAPAEEAPAATPTPQTVQPGPVAATESVKEPEEAQEEPAQVWRPAIGETVDLFDRHARISTAGYEPVTYNWPRSEVTALNRVVAAHRAEYRHWHIQQNRAGNYSLVFSSLVAHATRRALPLMETWLDRVPTDRRSARGRLEQAPSEPSRQVTMTWPTDLRLLVDDLFIDLQSRDWPEGFRLAKKNFVLTAVQSQIPTVGEWFHEIPNDARLLSPVPARPRP